MAAANLASSLLGHGRFGDGGQAVAAAVGIALAGWFVNRSLPRP